MGDSITDTELVTRVQRGDKTAFDLLVLKYQHRIVKLVGRYVREPADALDVTQDAFIKAYRALPNFRGESAFYTWLYRIAINTAKNHLVAASRRPNEGSPETHPTRNQHQSRCAHFNVDRNSIRFRRSDFERMFPCSSGIADRPRSRVVTSAFFTVSKPSSGELMTSSVSVSDFSIPA